MELVLIHRKASPDFPQDFPFALWKTCLRQVALLPKDGLRASILHEGDRVFEDENIFCLLLELCCGMHSPIMGETEVQGQFRSYFLPFSHEDPCFESAVRELAREVIEQAKRIRRGYLTNTGSRSYGSFVRKLCRDRRKIAILGSGGLAKDIFPWVEDRAVIVSRSPGKAALGNTVPYEADISPDAVVVAAPLGGREIHDWLESRGFSGLLMDLRGEGKGADGIRFPCERVLNLKDFFRYVREQGEEEALLREKVFEEIRSAALRRERRRKTGAVCRPFGWDDVCA